MQRIVIRVPPILNPSDRKLEVMLGKTLEVDCNRYVLSADVTAKVAQGWGFTYYVVGELKGPASTRMACAADFATHREFVRAPAEALAALRYNPNLPVVLYVPEGTEVRYRLWSAPSVATPALAE